MKRIIKLAAAHERQYENAPVHMRVVGFTRQTISPAEVVAAIRCVPNFHLVGLNEIVFDPDEAVFHRAGIWAFYCQSRRRICFLRLPKLSLFRHVLYHEIGHHVFALIISSKVKVLWVNRVASDTPSVSAYGATHPQEDFAEAYAMYLTPATEVRTAAQTKLRFFRQIVFSGDLWTLKEKHML